MRFGDKGSQRWIGNNKLVTNDHIVKEPNYYVSTAWVLNTIIFNI